MPDLLGTIRRAQFAQVDISLLEQCIDEQRKGSLFVYLWLWHYAGRADTAFPSVARLAVECRMNQRDIRDSLQWLTEEGWIKAQPRPGNTTIYHVRTERPERKRRTPTQKGSTPKGSGVKRYPSPKRARGVLPQTGEGTPPPNGTPNKRELTRSTEQESLSVLLPDYVSDIVPESSADDAPQTRQPQPVQPDDSGTSSQTATPPKQPQPITLPPCAEPHRDLVVAWWRARNRKHPKAARTLTPQDITALEYADGQGALPEFLQDAAATGRRTLGHAYRANVERVMAGSETSAGFDQFCAAYLAIQDRAHSQSITPARAAFTAAVRKGHTPAQIIAALRSNVAAYHAAQKRGQFAPTFPDMQRWLANGRYEAHMPREGASSPPEVVRPSGPVLDGVQMPF